ncbi:hypothetical protein C2G38_630846 [Gigaspora rosea]|uniref:Fanconi Anaemia group E protein C-terminal domain-containing protein n=1 Tax=Gigaspora rosea TaxID=44941 RepID=A0A397VSF5_9GLOM|nr:hypothetical protein C2G38_630846 [Gigaspora rosea]
MSKFHPLHEQLLCEWKLKLSKTEKFFPCPTLNGLFKDDDKIFDNFMQNLLDVQGHEEKLTSQPIFVPKNYIVNRRIQKKRKTFRISNEENLYHDESVKSSSQEIELELDHNESVKSSSQEVECEIDSYLFQSLKAKLMIGKADEILPDFNILMRLPHAQLNKIFKDLDISQLDDVVLAILCNEIVKHENIAYQNYVVFFKYGLLEKVRNIKSKPSRNFLANISNIAKAKSKPMVYGLLLPLITEFDISQPQLEVIARIIDSGLSEESIVALLNELFSDSYPSTSQIINSTSKDSYNLQIKWTSTTIDVLFSIFNQKFDLKEAASQHIIPKFLRQLDFNIELSPNDKKLGQLLMLLVTKHSKDFMENLEEIKVIAEKSKSFIKRGVLGQITNLMKKQDRV